MESGDNAKARESIIHGIKADAEQRAKKIADEATSSSEERMESARLQTARIEGETARTIEEQTAKIEKESSIRLSSRRRKMNLAMKERAFRAVLDRCAAMLAEKIDDDGYAEILTEWIVEAAAGLNAAEVRVNCSFQEREKVASVLGKAEELVFSRRGLRTSILLSEETPLSEQGVILTSADGRTAFNNQVNTRIQRKQTAIRKLLNDRLFESTQTNEKVSESDD